MYDIRDDIKYIIIHDLKLITAANSSDQDKKGENKSIGILHGSKSIGNLQGRGAPNSL